MFEYVFMQRGILVGILLGAIIPLVGVTVVLKRLSMIGDALSHTSLAGVAGGMIAGINPVAGAIAACLGGALCVEGVRRHFKDQSELAVAIVMAAGIGLAGVLSGFVPNSSSFNSFMFGSILTVSEQEVQMIVVISVLAVAFVVAVAARTVGSLIVSSMMVVPVACALQISRSWKQCCLYASTVGMLTSLGGLVISYELGLKPGGTIVLLAVVTLLFIFLVKRVVLLLKTRTV